MSCFSDESSDQIDWHLFQNGWVTMYWRKQLIEEHCGWLANHEYRLHRFNCSQWSSEEVALDEIASELSFPEYFGKNLDALNDCLRDLDVPAKGGLAIILMNYDQFALKNSQVAHAILDIFANHARSYMLFGKRLTMLVQSDDPKLEFAPVGATPVMWNPAEWLNSKRGV